MDLRKLLTRRAARLNEPTPEARGVSQRARLDQSEQVDVLVRQGRFDEAATQFLTLAYAHVENDQYALAIEFVNQALQADPENMEAAETLARLERVRSTLSRRDGLFELLANRLQTGRLANNLTPRDLQQYWPSIGDSALIADLNDDQLIRLLDAMEIQRWGNRSVLVRQGQYQPWCHLIVHGTVEAITMTSTGDSRVLLLFGPGDLIGDSLLFDEGELQASYRTTGAETAGLRLTKRSLNRLLKDASDRPTIVEALQRHGRDREVAALLGG